MRPRDERGEITIAGWVVISVIVFVGPTVLVGLNELFSDDTPKGGTIQTSVESSTVAGPAPPDNDCARDAYELQGLRWNDPGKPGWTVPGTDPPFPGEDNFNQKMRIYKAVVAGRVVDAVGLWKERGCDSIRGGEQAKPSPEPSPSESVTVSVAGTYTITEDTSRRATGAPAADDPLGCAARRVPTEITVSNVSSNLLSLTFSDTPGSPAFTSNADYNPSEGKFVANYPDASGKYIQGRFFVAGGSVALVDGQMYSGECTFFFDGTKS